MRQPSSPAMLLQAALLAALCALPTIAAATQPTSANAPMALTSAAPAIQRLPDVVVRGRIAKPSVHFILARNYRAPTHLMSHELWQDKLAQIAAGAR